jgi:hypothetical protein
MTIDCQPKIITACRAETKMGVIKTTQAGVADINVVFQAFQKTGE